MPLRQSKHLEKNFEKHRKKHKYITPAVLPNKLLLPSFEQTNITSVPTFTLYVAHVVACGMKASSSFNTLRLNDIFQLNSVPLPTGVGFSFFFLEINFSTKRCHSYVVKTAQKMLPFVICVLISASCGIASGLQALLFC